MKLILFSFIFAVCSAISAFCVFTNLNIFEHLSADSQVHQNVSLDSKSDKGSETLEVESIEDEVDSYINEFNVVGLNFNFKLNPFIESSLLLISGSHDIQIPPPKSI